MVQASLRMLDDPTVVELSQERMNRRFAAMREVIARIDSEGRLATGWDVETATGFLWSMTAPSSFDLLVAQHGWTPTKWADSTFQLLRDAFITPAPASPIPDGQRGREERRAGSRASTRPN